VDNPKNKQGQYTRFTFHYRYNLGTLLNLVSRMEPTVDFIFAAFNRANAAT